jgi:ribose-phosphate pyrophosphokinase
MVVTDTIPLSAKMAKCEKITPLSVAPLIGEAIRRTHLERSISSLF